MTRATRRWIGAIGPALVLGIAGLTASCSLPLGVGPEPSCACASLQTEVPWPVSQAAARQAAVEYLGTVDPEVGRASQEPVHLLITTGGNGFALVDGDTGRIAEVAMWPALAGGASRLISPRQALDAALAFLSAHPDLRAPGTANITESGAGLDLVTWVDAGAASAVVAVNAGTGAVASFVDLRTHSDLVAPVLGADAATALAISAFGIAGEEAAGTPEFRVEVDPTGHQRTIWSVGLGVPSPTEPGVFLSGGVVEIDAVTGAATIVKK